MAIDLNDVVYLARVVETGSFSAAARRLAVPKSTVSRRIARLEKDLGVRLLQRTTRKLGLTDAGELYYQYCSRALSQLDEGQRLLSHMQQAPSGTLRLTAPPDLAQPLVGQLVAEFGRRFPEVHVVAEMTTRVVDLVAEGFDLAIRAGTLSDSSLVARRLATFGIYLWASPEYLANARPLKQPSDLRRHRCLLLGSERTRATWTLQGPSGIVAVDVEGELASNDVTLLRRAAVAGRGVARLPTITCFEEEGARRLVRVLPEFQCGEAGVYAVFPSGAHLSPKVRAFVELAVEVMSSVELLAR
jgi:DNA-binding transcriptional LysR family regulator